MLYCTAIIVHISHTAAYSHFFIPYIFAVFATGSRLSATAEPMTVYLLNFFLRHLIHAYGNKRKNSHPPCRQFITINSYLILSLFAFYFIINDDRYVQYVQFDLQNYIDMNYLSTTYFL